MPLHRRAKTPRTDRRRALHRPRVEGSWQVVVGGAARKSVRKADLLATVETTGQALEASELFFQYYRENANYLERTYDFVERLGIEKVRKETVYAPDAVREGLLDRLAKSKARARDAWQEGQEPRHPTQFATVQPLEWYADREIAIFNLGPSTALGPGDRFLAVDNRCPHKGGPLADGIVTGTSVVCPLHTWKISLLDGRVERPSGAGDEEVTAYPVRVAAGVEVVGLAVNSPEGDN